MSRSTRPGRPVSMYDTTTHRINNAVARDRHALGPRLGLAARQCGLSAKDIAGLLDASAPTVYRWFFGESEPSRAYRSRAIRMMKILQWAVASGRTAVAGYTPEETVLNYRELSSEYSRVQNLPVDIG